MKGPSSPDTVSTVVLTRHMAAVLYLLAPCAQIQEFVGFWRMNGRSHQGLLVQLLSMNLTSVCVDQIFSLLNHVTNNSMHAVHSCFLTGDVIYLFFLYSQ